MRLFQCKSCEKYHFHIQNLQINLDKEDLFLFYSELKYYIDKENEYLNKNIVWTINDQINIRLSYKELKELFTILGMSFMVINTEKIIHEE